MSLQNIDVQTAKKWLDNQEAILIDVREPGEYRAEKIDNSHNIPSGSITLESLPKTAKKILIQCQRGARGTSAVKKLLKENKEINVYNVEGGIESWKEAGFAVSGNGTKTLPLDRQVQLTIGLSVLIFSLLAYFSNPVFAFGAAFFGAGLLNAGLTGWCGLGMLMAKMPWNR